MIKYYHIFIFPYNPLPYAFNPISQSTHNITNFCIIKMNDIKAISWKKKLFIGKINSPSCNGCCYSVHLGTLFLISSRSVSIILLVLFLFLIPSLANWVGGGVTTLYTDPFYPHLHQPHTDNFWSTSRFRFWNKNS